MTAQAAKSLPMADRAAWLIEVHLARAVGRDETFYVTGGLEVIVLGVALFATERIVDLVVADDAVRHLRHVEGGNLVALRQSAMAGVAGVLRIEVPADVARGLQIGLLIDGGRNHRSDVAHLEMLLVAEMSHPGGRWSRDLHRGVATGADLLIRKQVVGRLRARAHFGVTRHAFHLQFDVKLMGKRGGAGCRSPEDQQRERVPHPL